MTDRRKFVKTALLLTAAGSLPSGVSAIAPARSGVSGRYAAVKSSRLLSDLSVLARIEGKDVLTEGPACDRNGICYFTHVRASKILKWDPQAQQVTTFSENSNNTNGMYFDSQGRLLCCEGGSSARRITRRNVVTGEVEVLADRYDGKPLAAPNDICTDAKGRIYFTARGGVKELEGISPKAVYRIDLDGRLVRLLVEPEQTQMPNGLIVSLDNKTLYVIETHPDADHHRDIRAFELSADGVLNNERLLIDFYPGRSGDGMAIDARGNLYVAAGLHQTRGTSETLATRPGIHVISPVGKLLAFRETPEDILTNCTFGGEDLRTLYVTCGPLLLSLRTAIPGAARYRPLA